MADHDPIQLDMLKTFVADRNVPCPVCGYNLRNLSSARCPECSASLEMRVGSSDLRIGLWLVALLSAALPFGFGALISIVGLILAVLYGGPEWEFHIAFGSLSIIKRRPPDMACHATTQLLGHASAASNHHRMDHRCALDRRRDRRDVVDLVDVGDQRA